MRRRPGIPGVAAFFIGMWLVVAIVESPRPVLAADEAALLDRINVVRRQHHLGPLRASDRLARVARAHAEEMARDGYLSHVNPAGKSPLDRVRAAGVDGFRLLAENIGSSSARGDRVGIVIEHWLDSPVHRENLLTPAFNTTGIGIGRGPADQTIYVQLFATF